MDNLTKVIYGKNEEDCIVNISIKNNNAHIFKEKDGIIEESIVPFKPWVLSNVYSNGCQKLLGNQHYKYIKEYNTQEQFNAIKDSIYKYGLFTVHHFAESFMIRNGHTYFKNMKVEDVSVLSFDIETNGLDPHKKDSTVYLITNAYRRKIKGTNKTLTYYKTFNKEDYETPQDMIRDWCNWVMEVDPSIMIGYNIISFDFPYLQGMLSKTNEELILGRDFSEIEIEEKSREKGKMVVNHIVIKELTSLVEK